MRRIAIGYGIVALVVTSIAIPPSYAAPETRELAAQARPRITIHPRETRPGPYAKRYCRSWLAQEYRVSGTVIVPRMQCWWR